MTTHWFVVSNTASGKGKAGAFMHTVQEFMNRHGLDFELDSPDDQNTFIKVSKALRAGQRNFLVCGGDGTLNQCVNAIFQQSEVPHADCKVAFLPFGTGNDWIRTAGIPADPEKALDVLIHGREVRMDVGKVTSQWFNARKDAYFINIAGFAYDAFVVEQMELKFRKDKMGKIAYLLAVFSFLLRYKRTQVKVRSAEYDYDGPLFSGCAGICKYNGNGMMQVPHADPYDGKLAVTLMQNTSKWDVLMQTKNLYNGTFIKHKTIHTFQTEHFTLESDPLVRLECEGEILGFSPFEFSVKPAALRIMVP